MRLLTTSKTVGGRRSAAIIHPSVHGFGCEDAHDRSDNAAGANPNCPVENFAVLHLDIPAHWKVYTGKSDLTGGVK